MGVALDSAWSITLRPVTQMGDPGSLRTDPRTIETISPARRPQEAEQAKKVVRYGTALTEQRTQVYCSAPMQRRDRRQGVPRCRPQCIDRGEQRLAGAVADAGQQDRTAAGLDVTSGST
jgi:hypothetical protein